MAASFTFDRIVIPGVTAVGGALLDLSKVTPVIVKPFSLPFASYYRLGADNPDHLDINGINPLTPYAPASPPALTEGSLTTVAGLASGMKLPYLDSTSFTQVVVNRFLKPATPVSPAPVHMGCATPALNSGFLLFQSPSDNLLNIRSPTSAAAAVPVPAELVDGEFVYMAYTVSANEDGTFTTRVDIGAGSTLLSTTFGFARSTIARNNGIGNTSYGSAGYYGAVTSAAAGYATTPISAAQSADAYVQIKADLLKRGITVH